MYHLKRPAAAGMCLGLAVHLKLYPVIYAPAALAFPVTVAAE